MWLKTARCIYNIGQWLLPIGDFDECDYIFEGNCFWVTFLELSNVKDDKIVSVKYSDQLCHEKNILPQTETKIHLMIPNYGCDNLYLHSKRYHNIEGSFNISTNISLSRLLFTKTHVFADNKFSKWYCDLNMIIFGINNNNIETKNAFIYIISLSSKLMTIIADSSCGNVTLFDGQYGYLFTLSTQLKYDTKNVILKNMTLKNVTVLVYSDNKCKNYTQKIINNTPNKQLINTNIFNNINDTVTFLLIQSINKKLHLMHQVIHKKIH